MRKEVSPHTNMNILEALVLKCAQEINNDRLKRVNLGQNGIIHHE